MNIRSEIVNGVEIDWDKRDWKRIYTPEEEIERASKALRLNGGPVYPLKLVAASSSVQKQKPTVRIKRLYPPRNQDLKIKSASTIMKEMDREKERQEERARTEKILKLIGGLECHWSHYGVGCI